MENYKSVFEKQLLHVYHYSLDKKDGLADLTLIKALRQKRKFGLCDK